MKKCFFLKCFQRHGKKNVYEAKEEEDRGCASISRTTSNIDECTSEISNRIDSVISSIKSSKSLHHIDDQLCILKEDITKIVTNFLEEVTQMSQMMNVEIQAIASNASNVQQLTNENETLKKENQKLQEEYAMILMGSHTG